MSRYKIWADVNGKVETFEWINGEIIADPRNVKRFRALMTQRGAGIDDGKRRKP